MRRLVSLVFLGAALVATPSAAQADVYLNVPVRFLGGPIAPALPVAGAAAGDSAPAGAPLSVAAPAAAQTGLLGYPCDADSPLDCMEWTEAPIDFSPPPGSPDADGDTPTPVPTAGATPTPALFPAQVPVAAEATSVAGGLLSPAPESWLPWQTPLLRWTPVAHASHYNVQVFRGSQLVMSAWPRTNRLRVPRGVLKQGRTYVWVVWTGHGTRATPTYDPTPIGRATFEVTLRPRLVFRRAPGHPGMTQAEVRPHIPLARLRLSSTFGPLLRRVPSVVTLSANGRALLPVPPRVAERLQVALSDRGPAPPLGLRAP